MVWYIRFVCCVICLLSLNNSGAVLQQGWKACTVRNDAYLGGMIISVAGDGAVLSVWSAINPSRPAIDRFGLPLAYSRDFYLKSELDDRMEFFEKSNSDHGTSIAMSYRMSGAPEKIFPVFPGGRSTSVIDDVDSITGVFYLWVVWWVGVQPWLNGHFREIDPLRNDVYKVPPRISLPWGWFSGENWEVTHAKNPSY